jgi:hypothetical protein
VLGVGSFGMQGPMGNGAGTMTVSALLFLLMAVGWVRTVQRRLSLAEIVVALSLAVIVSWPF